MFVDEIDDVNASDGVREEIRYEQVVSEWCDLVIKYYTEDGKISAM